MQEPTRKDERRRLLIIDDEPAILKAFERLLRGAYDIVTAASVPEALERIETDGAFHLILCDVVLPGASGLDLRRILEASGSALCSRLFFMSGELFTLEQQGLPEELRKRALAKPADPRALETWLRDRWRELAELDDA